MNVKQLTDLLNSPIVSAVTRGIIILGTVATPVMLFAAARWFDERVAEAPAVLSLIQQLNVNEGSARSANTALGEVTLAARELTKEVAALKLTDSALAAEIKAAHVSNASVERQVVILQTQLAAQRAEDLRRFDDMGRKLDKIGDRLGVP